MAGVSRRRYKLWDSSGLLRGLRVGILYSATLIISVSAQSNMTTEVPPNMTTTTNSTPSSIMATTTQSTNSSIMATITQSTNSSIMATITQSTPVSNMDTTRSSSSSSPLGLSDDAIFGICAAAVIVLLLTTIIVLAVHLLTKTRKQRHHIAGNAENNVEELELTKAKTLTAGERHSTSNGRTTSHNPGANGERVLSHYHRYENTLTFSKPTGIPLADYPKYVQDNRQSLELIEEFEALPGVNQEKQNYAREEQNKPKNRYRNILPYNNSRVVLEMDGDDPFSDYINASYIDSFTREKAYIASQGPKKNTIGDFWRMVWQERIRVVSMVTKLEEGLKTKCERYWPELNTDAEYGMIHIKADSIEELDFGVIREFSVRKGHDVRKLTHFQFTKWPDKSVPKQTPLFLRYLRAVKAAYMKDDSAPLLVHCSAGIGRSGVAIAMDSVVDQALKTDRVNVHGFVQAMRDCRQNMVQTDEQYVFLHEAILESLICKDTRIPVEEFTNQLQKLKEKEGGSEETNLADEFKTLGRICPDPSHLAVRTGCKPECQAKNRDHTILPIERNRAMLQTHYSNSPSGDYINASFVKGATTSNYFIVTQMPLPETVVDFWSLVYDYKPAKIVMMNELDRTDPTCAQYWPDGGSIQHGPFTISTTSTEKHVGMIIRTLQVQLTDTQNVRVVHQYQFLGWPGDNSRLNDQCKSLLLDLLQTVYPTPSTANEEEGISKVLVHCMNGAGKSGVFCALKMTLDQIAEENAVDIFQTIKSLRTDRMRMVTTEDQYLFCYETTDEYLKRKDEDERTEDEADDVADDDIGVQTDSQIQTNETIETTNANSNSNSNSEHVYQNEAFVKDE